MGAMSAEVWSALGLGALLGVRHALDADHVAAVTTIVSQHRAIRRAVWIGAWWGIGHSAILLVVGTLVVAFKLAIPERTALSFELLVGVMLVVLGGMVLWRVRRQRWHWHVHAHEGEVRHAHLHAHPGRRDEDPSGAGMPAKASAARESDAPSLMPASPAHRHQPHEHAHSLAFGIKPLMIGMVHGLAGSAGLTLLVGATLPSVSLGVLYFVLFGAGSIVGMSALTLAVSVPFAVAAERLGPAYRGLVVVAGVGSVVVGVWLIRQVGWVEGLFVFGADALVGPFAR